MIPWEPSEEHRAAARVALEVLQSAGLRDARAVAVLAQAVADAGGASAELEAYAPPAVLRGRGIHGQGIYSAGRGPGTWVITLEAPDSGKLLRGDP